MFSYIPYQYGEDNKYFLTIDITGPIQQMTPNITEREGEEAAKFINNGDYCHRIIMKIIQSSYSSLLAKNTSTMLKKDSSLHNIHKGNV